MPVFINLLGAIPMMFTVAVLYAPIGDARFAGFYFLGMVIVLDIIIIKKGDNHNIEAKFLNSITILGLFVSGVVFAILNYGQLLPDGLGNEFSGAIFLVSSLVSLLPLYSIFKTKTESMKMNFFTKIGFKSRGIPFLLIGFFLMGFSIFKSFDKIEFLKNGEMDSFFQLWGGIAMIAFMGFVFLYIGGMLFVFSQKNYLDV